MSAVYVVMVLTDRPPTHTLGKDKEEGTEEWYPLGAVPEATVLTVDLGGL